MFLFFFLKKLGNSELYKVPIERLHVSRRQKMPVVQKQRWTETFCLDKSFRDRWRLYSHMRALVHRAKKKKYKYIFDLWEKIRPLIGEWYIPLTDVKDALSSKAISSMYSCCTKKPSEVSLGVKYRPQNAHKDGLHQLHQNWRCIH